MRYSQTILTQPIVEERKALIEETVKKQAPRHTKLIVLMPAARSDVLRSNLQIVCRKSKIHLKKFKYFMNKLHHQSYPIMAPKNTLHNIRRAISHSSRFV